MDDRGRRVRLLTAICNGLWSERAPQRPLLRCGPQTWIRVKPLAHETSDGHWRVGMADVFFDGSIGPGWVKIDAPHARMEDPPTIMMRIFETDGTVTRCGKATARREAHGAAVEADRISRELFRAYERGAEVAKALADALKRPTAPPRIRQADPDTFNR